jgi:creatinine amidohydrolase
VIRLLELPHARARRVLTSGAPVFVGVNPVEYHGPHLSLHNDACLARWFTTALHARLAQRHDWPLIVVEDLELGVQPTRGPGSRSLPFPVVRDAVVETVRALVELGARRVVLMSFHGDPLHAAALDAGVECARAAGAPALDPFNLVTRRLLDPPGDELDRAFDGLADSDRARVRAALPLDFHAGFFETSLSLHCAPETVDPDHVELPPCPSVTRDPGMDRLAGLARASGRTTLARELDLVAWGLGWGRLDPHPGYTGEPGLARAESGAVFAEAILETYEETATAVLLEDDAPPRPILGWLRAATLGGRLHPGA